MQPSHDTSKTCFVFSDGEGGFVVKMCQPSSGRPLHYKLDMHNATQLQKQLADAVADMVPAEDKWFQK